MVVGARVEGAVFFQTDGVIHSRPRRQTPCGNDLAGDVVECQLRERWPKTFPSSRA